MEAIFIFLGILIFAYIASFEYYARKFGVITAHSHKDMIDAMIAEIRVSAPNASKIVDPGRRNGHMVREIARHFPDTEVIGLELSPSRFCAAG